MPLPIIGAVAGAVARGVAVAGRTALSVGKKALAVKKVTGAVSRASGKKHARGRMQKAGGSSLMSVEMDTQGLDELTAAIKKTEQYVASVDGKTHTYTEIVDSKKQKTEKYEPPLINLKSSNLHDTEDQAQFATDNKEVVSMVDDICDNILKSLG